MNSDDQRSVQAPSEHGRAVAIARFVLILTVLAWGMSCQRQPDDGPNDSAAKTVTGKDAVSTKPPADPRGVTASDTPHPTTAATFDGTPPSNQTASADSAATRAVANVVTESGQDRWSQLEASLDPHRDGWESEAMADGIGKRLKVLSKLLSADQPLSRDTIGDLLAASCECSPLIPVALVDVVRDPSVQVRRAADPDAGTIPHFKSSDELLQQFGSLRDRFSDMADVRFSFKVFRIETSPEAATAQVLYEGRGLTPQGTVQHNATWHTKWSISNSTDEPQLTSITITDFEEITTSTGTPTLYSDCTVAVLGADESFQKQLRYGAGYWMQRLPEYLSPRLLEGHIGIAVGDINEDGREDVYVCQPGGLPNRLYVQNADGTANDISRLAGVDVLDWSYSALIIDLDNDGHQDLVVLADTVVLIYQGDGQGHFVPRAKLPGTFEYAITAADYDADGDLDLYACNYFSESHEGLAQLARSDPLHDSNTGGRNALFRNDGQWGFDDVTDEVGLDAGNQRWSLAAGWEDFDNDGDADLYVVNDFGHNNLYRNDGGTFVEVADRAGAVDANQGMSVSWADYDHDGWMDVYVSNMFSAAGNRVTTQPNFMPGVSDETKGLYRQLARGNTLLRNEGDGTFRDVSLDAGVTMGRWAWASLFTDINNDGWDDLLVTNGYLTQDIVDDL